ncbi:MAG: PTS sugar transporter subunit IIB [Anaerolineae bacterium]
MAPESPVRRFGLVRVDERLLHGQVVLNWVRTLGMRRIVVVDDVLVGDELARQAMALAVPAGVDLDVADVAAAAESLAAGRGTLDADTMVLVRGAAIALALRRAGVAYAHLNVGFLGRAAGRVRVHPQVYLSPDELEALRSLAAQGVSISFQAVPSEAPLDWGSVLGRVARRSAW